jgi:hypothetical protein
VVGAEGVDQVAQVGRLVDDTVGVDRFGCLGQGHALVFVVPHLCHPGECPGEGAAAVGQADPQGGRLRQHAAEQEPGGGDGGIGRHAEAEVGGHAGDARSPARGWAEDEGVDEDDESQVGRSGEDLPQLERVELYAHGGSGHFDSSQPVLTGPSHHSHGSFGMRDRDGAESGEPVRVPGNDFRQRVVDGVGPLGAEFGVGPVAQQRRDRRQDVAVMADRVHSVEARLDVPSARRE